MTNPSTSLLSVLSQLDKLKKDNERLLEENAKIKKDFKKEIEELIDDNIQLAISQELYLVEVVEKIQLLLQLQKS